VSSAQRYRDEIGPLLPEHAYIQGGDPECRNWVATWTTPKGLWQIDFKDPREDPSHAKVIAPGCITTLGYYPAPGLVIELLRALGGFQPAED
jgi:hypothetical protein